MHIEDKDKTNEENVFKPTPGSGTPGHHRAAGLPGRGLGFRV